MTRSTRPFAAACAAAILVLTAAAPARAEDPSEGFVQVRLEVVGYTAGFDGTDFTAWLNCQGPAGAIGISLHTSPLTDDSEPAGPFPTGSICYVEAVDFGWAGEMGDFSPDFGTSGAVLVGTSTARIDLTVERTRNGRPPEWDAGAEFALDPFTADRAYVNRYGGLTVEGRILCAALRATPFDQYVGVSWEATQYVGRKGAITARYDPAIALDCLNESAPTVPVVWTTRGPGTQDQVQWIYASNGKFGAGMVHLEIRVESRMNIVTQWWDPDGEGYDPACSPVDPGNGWFDRNGDGYCAFTAVLWGAEQYDLRAERAR